MYPVSLRISDGKSFSIIEYLSNENFWRPILRGRAVDCEINRLVSDAAQRTNLTLNFTLTSKKNSQGKVSLCRILFNFENQVHNYPF